MDYSVENYPGLRGLHRSRALPGDPDLDGRGRDDLPHPDRTHHAVRCPGCGHAMGEHAMQLGCLAGWEYEGPGSPWAGLAKSEGCDCPLTLAEQHQPPDEGDL